MPFVLFLLGAAAVGLVAATASAKGKKPDGGGGRTYTLDSNLPPQLRQQVLAALATEKDPNRLLAFAVQCATGGYPLAAAALTQRAVELGGVPQPFPQPQPGPQPQPQPQPAPAVNPVDPGLLPDPPRTQVLAALSIGTDPNALEALAQQMDAQGYTFAAQALRMKETLLRGMTPPSPSPQPSPPQPGPPAPQPQPTPVQPQPVPVPVPSPFSLDPGMPPQMQSAVLGALTTEQDPNKLQAFAQEIQAQYPIAAGLLMAKANALRMQPSPFPPPQPGPQPTPVGPTPPGPGPFPVPPLPGGLPIGDDTTRSGRNAGRPAGYPFIHLRGESTYPAKIAKQATGSEANYPQMSAINPQFAKDGVHWINIQTGDALNIPWAWVPKLTGLYRIEVDPGVGPPGVLAPAAAVAAHAPSTALVRKGGSNGLATTHA